MVSKEKKISIELGSFFYIIIKIIIMVRKICINLLYISG